VTPRPGPRPTRPRVARRLATRGFAARALAAGLLAAGLAASVEGQAARRDTRTIRRVRDSVQAVLARGLADGAYPGAIAVVGSRRGPLATVAVGRLDPRNDTAPTPTTRWDLASLTKVIATTTLVMQLVDEGRVRLDTPVVHYLPEWRGERVEGITVRHLLTHASGLPAWRAFYKEADDAAEARAQLLLVAPDGPPGRRMVYSDIGFLLLGRMVERVTGMRLDSAFAARVARPLALHGTGYLPPWEARPAIAPTEFDPWRQRQAHGDVHDENAYRFGGIAGHAGLFGTAADLSRVAQALLAGGRLGGTRLVSARTLREFTRVQDTLTSRRALGWETPTGTNSAGRRLSSRAFGHTGFTGTSLWIDPARDLYVLLLTNRVNPTRQTNRVGAVRSGLADAVVGALTPTASAPASGP
jgi:CubicO group peptidase (beta-lactamase class C family)